MSLAEPEVVVRLFLMGTGPFITLAAASSLDFLGLPGVPIYIPDAVLFEETVKDGALGSRDILDWVQENVERVHVIPTAAFRNHLMLTERNPLHKTPDLGERAAIEVAFDVFKPAAGELAVLLTEDAGAPPRRRTYRACTAQWCRSRSRRGRATTANFVGVLMLTSCEPRPTLLK